ncbi:unnamed protein product, partial [Effrenium voratum]
EHHDGAKYLHRARLRAAGRVAGAEVPEHGADLLLEPQVEHFAVHLFQKSGKSNLNVGVVKNHSLSTPKPVDPERQEHKNQKFVRWQMGAVQCETRSRSLR